MKKRLLSFLKYLKKLSVTILSIKLFRYIIIFSIQVIVIVYFMKDKEIRSDNYEPIKIEKPSMMISIPQIEEPIINKVAIPEFKLNDCSKCNNTGKVICDHCKGKGIIEIPCLFCKGTGGRFYKECSVCSGNKIVPSTGENCSKCNATGYEKEICKACNGEKTNKTKCEHCYNSYITCPQCHGINSANNHK